MTDQEIGPDAPRVLIVDDDFDTRLLYRTFLSMEGFAVTDIADAESALRHIDRIDPDALVTDLNLPGLSGLELAATVRARERRIAMIAVTGRAPRDIGEHREVFDVILTKPCALDQLLNAIDDATARLSISRRRPGARGAP